MTAVGLNLNIVTPGHSCEARTTEAADVAKAIYQRRAIRVYADKPVTRDNVDFLVDVAIHAPSAVKCQPWAFVVIQEREVLTRYAKEGKQLLLNEPPRHRGRRERVAGHGSAASDGLRPRL